MNASVGETFNPEHTVPNPGAGMPRSPDVPVGQAPPVPPCLRTAPQSPLPSDFERAVMDTAAHARYTGCCEQVLRAQCRKCFVAGAGLVAIAVALVVYVPAPWLAAVPAALAVGAAWRWAVFSAAADELRSESAR